MSSKKQIKVQTPKKKGVTESPAKTVDEATAIEPQAGIEADAEPSDVDPMAAKLQELEIASKENYDRYLRVSAEFENYQKRAAREQTEFKKFANESLIKALLPIVDDLERALESTPKGSDSVDAIRQGVSLTLENIGKVFDNFNVERIEAMGEPFDPTFHEAVMQENDADHPDNTVIREFQKGYLLNGRLIRPSMVVVSKSSKTTPPGDKTDKS